MAPASVMSRTWRSWKSTAYHQTKFAALLAALLCCRRVLGLRRVGLLFLLIRRLLVPGLQVGDELLQTRNSGLQCLDLPVSGVQFLLVVRGKPGERLLKELDIALQT